MKAEQCINLERLSSMDDVESKKKQKAVREIVNARLRRFYAQLQRMACERDAERPAKELAADAALPGAGRRPL